MAHRTTKRAGMYTETGRGSAVANVQKSKGISIVTKYKGLQDNKNDVVAVQDSLADVNNLYIDDNDLLSSRPPVKLYTPVHNEFASDKCHSIRMWNIEGYIFRLMRRISSRVDKYYLVCDNKIPDSTVTDGSKTYFDGNMTIIGNNRKAEAEEIVSFAPIEDKIFICMGANWAYFNTKNYRFYEFYASVDYTYLYVPIRYDIVNGVYKEFEALNYLTTAYRNRYHYSMSSSVDFGQLDKWVRVYTAADEKYLYQLDTINYPNKDISSVLVYPLAFVDTPDYYDVVEREDGPVIMCWYESTHTIKISLDGKVYFTLNNFPTGNMIGSYVGGHPYLSKDGNTVVVCMVEGIYFANLFNLEASNYRTFEKHLYLENAMQEDGTLYNDGDGVTLNGVDGFIAYFYSETVYAYFFWTLTGLVDVFAGICISHMRDTQKIDFIDMSYLDFPINGTTDKICMCPRYLDYIYSSDSNDFTPGPIIMYTSTSGISIDCIAYKVHHDSVDDIIGFEVTSLGSVFDAVDTANRDYIDICMSAQPNYYTDSYNNKQADIELTAAYRASGQSNYLILAKGYVNRSNAYTRLKRARSALQSSAGTPYWISVSTSLSRVFWSIKWGDNSVTQHYYHWDDLPYSAPPIVPETISSYVPDYIVPVNLPAKIVTYGGKENLWALKDNAWWTTELFADTVLYLDTYIGAISNDGPVASVTKMFTHFAALQEYYFSFGNTLAVTSTRRNDNNEFLLYLPADDTQECISEITNLCNISTQYVGVFLEDSIWYAGMEYLNNTLVHKKLMKSKIPFGCKKGTDILVASDGQSIIFPTYRGIALLGPQDFVATTDPVINYISDNIQNFYLRFYSEVMFTPYVGQMTGSSIIYSVVFEREFAISFVTYKYWMFMYKRYSREALLYDMRDNTWWTWTMPYPVVDMAFTDRLYVLLHTAEKGASYKDFVNSTAREQRLCDLFVVADKEADLGYALENFPRIDPSVDDFEYEDELIPNTLNGDVRVVKDDTDDGTHIELPLPQSRIDWFLISQKLYLGALNNYKTITGINIVAKGLYEYGTKLAMKAFRNIDHPEESIDMNVFIKDLRTFVQRLNLMHTIFFQYKLSNTDDDKQRQAHIASLCVKYETKEGVR